MNTELQPATSSRFRGVVFDMDGVLCDSEPFICEAARRMFAEKYQLQVRPEDFLPFVGAGENRYLGGVAEQYGITWDLQEDKRRTYDIYLDIIRGRLEPLAGVRLIHVGGHMRGSSVALTDDGTLLVFINTRDVATGTYKNAGWRIMNPEQAQSGDGGRLLPGENRAVLELSMDGTTAARN